MLLRNFQFAHEDFCIRQMGANGRRTQHCAGGGFAGWRRHVARDAAARLRRECERLSGAAASTRPARRLDRCRRASPNPRRGPLSRPRPPDRRLKESAELPHEKYAWTRWRVRLPAERVLEAARAEAADGSNTRTREARTLHVMCRATDSSYGTQPLDVAPIWNMRGLLHTAVHRITLNLNVS